mmetsp:Transcript_21311/g.47071  ORF Transcript_21311/g.47071 Transcript_21311/m.47071 type:complete len:365 (-) Transcript_21311:81-1175(-)|eukprot:CAMPEP_0170614082 /NCGR_PEP_ID=MMETSP0224-20130122/24610_1 /TAXON_ID=285029 /ORGANISM="Togula jolla, Strain CCCM 725" /LENGTH=364 /DNA_ID=CAMNT_0010939715 /DNA_START=102 /DNA_END=1196 /DNA_ORIENTATION=-
MGNKLSGHPCFLLTSETALHVKASNLVRDVLPIIARWRKKGADPSLGLAEFEQTFDIVKQPESQFKVFDISGKGKVDAHEVLMVYVILSLGEVELKVDTIFSVFDFPGSRSEAGTINFEEAMFLISACVQGLQKACEVGLSVDDGELIFHCRSLFDIRCTPHSSRVGREQFVEWVWENSSARSFLLLFHQAQGLPDVFSRVQRRTLEQTTAFRMLSCGQSCVTPEALMASENFNRLLESPSEEELGILLEMLAEQNGTIVSSDRFHRVLRCWNIYNECNLNQRGIFEDKDIEKLLWLHLRERPTADFAHQFLLSIEREAYGTITREEWCRAVLQDSDRKSSQPRRISTMSVSPEHLELLSPVSS